MKENNAPFYDLKATMLYTPQTEVAFIETPATIVEHPVPEWYFGLAAFAVVVILLMVLMGTGPKK